MNWSLHAAAIQQHLVAQQLQRQARATVTTIATVASQAAIQRATGIAVPTAVVDDGVKNAYAKREGIEVHTGVEPWRIPSIYAHEVGHVLMGHTSTRPLHPVYAEAEADYAAGYLMAVSNMASASNIGTSMTSMAMGAGGDHGGAAERATRVWLGFLHGAAAQNPWALYR